MATEGNPMSTSDPLQQLFPLHGPYDPVRTTDAAHLIDELVRYLAYATRHEPAMPGPNEAYELAGALKLAAGKLPQALRQMSARIATDPACPESTLVIDTLRDASAAAGTLARALSDVQSTLRDLALRDLAQGDLAPGTAGPDATVVGFPAPARRLAA
ncbi:hypothetical protein [Winogradskya consettensis]|nr:hypothetical protein [Actinoplanes consettensis]